MLRLGLHINILSSFNSSSDFFSCALNSYTSWSLVALVLKRCAWMVEQDIHKLGVEKQSEMAPVATRRTEPLHVAGGTGLLFMFFF